MVKNRTEYSWLEQRSVIKFLLVEKCKPCEFYWEICDVDKLYTMHISMFTL